MPTKIKIDHIKYIVMIVTKIKEIFGISPWGWGKREGKKYIVQQHSNALLSLKMSIKILFGSKASTH